MAPSQSTLSNSARNGSADRGLLALVRWLSGAYTGTMTSNVNVSWIRDFDPNNVDCSESYIVEWRTLPKPKSGFPLYDCKILEVSRDADFLRRRMEEIKLSDTDNEDGSQCQTPISSRNSTESEAPLLRDVLNSLRETLQSQSRGQRPNGGNSSFSSTPDENQNVTKVGSALVVSNTAYIMAKAAPSPSAMTLTLVRAAFSKGRLRRSTYAGQKRNGVSKPGLKRYKKMQDIQDFVKSRFPYFTQAAFGAAVNNCVGKNVDRERFRELCDESESEDEL